MPRLRTTTSARRAFTLIELLVVISIIVFLFAITFPFLWTMIRSTRVNTGVSTLGAAASAARAEAAKRSSYGDPPRPFAYDNGAAMIFSTRHDIRIAAFNQALSSSPGSSDGQFHDAPNRDYINLPASIGVMGIVGPAPPGGKAALIAPPFTVRFNKQGSLILNNGTRPADAGGIYYSWEGDPDPAASLTWPDQTYDPDVYDPLCAAYNGKANRITTIEPVIGVVLYLKSDFDYAGLNRKARPVPPGGDDRGLLNQAATDWLLTPDPSRPDQLLHARVILFSRSTGTQLRE